MTDFAGIMNRRSQLILFFLLIFYGIRMFFIGQLELAPDESYYWYWSQYLDLSYFDHPPMVAYIMSFFTMLGGSNELFVRLGGLLCTAITQVFIFLTARSLFPSHRQMAWDLLFIANITILFSAACIVQTPDTPLMLFWSIALYCGAKIIQYPAPRWWYLWGAALGLGLSSKYTMILIVPCQFAFIILDPNQRRWLLRKEPYLALLLGLLIFSPVIYWNAQHDWLSFAFQLHHGFDPRKHSGITKLLAYLGGQAGVITPLIFLAFVFYSIKAVRLNYQKTTSQYLYLMMLSWPIIFFFAVSSVRGKVAAANWPAPAYIAGLILMYSIYHERYIVKKFHRVFVTAAVILAIILNIVLHVHLLHPILPLPPDQDTTKQFHGWQKLGEMISTYISENPHEQGYFLLGDHNQRLTEAVFYSSNRYPGVKFTNPFIFLPALKDLKGKNAIILEYGFGDSSLSKYRPYFDKVFLLGKYRYTFRKTEISDRSVHILMGHGYNGKRFGQTQ
jgi:4-amino-4-deoxy-L-arabinose transferase-like glycosyltransferase